MKKKNITFISIITVTLIGLLLLSAFFNAQSFQNNYIDTTASNNAVITKNTANQLEYSLKYGKTLKNYYGIDQVFEELYKYCGYLEESYLADAGGQILYQSTHQTSSFFIPSDLKEHTAALNDSALSYTTWQDEDKQHVLVPIRDSKDHTIAALGISYDLKILRHQTSPYVKNIYLNMGAATLAGILLFLMLFFLIRHEFIFKRLLWIILPVIMLSNALFGILSYRILKNGYMDIAQNTSDIFKVKIMQDIDRVVSQGVPYEDLYEIDRYFEDILSNTDQLEQIRLVLTEPESSEEKSSYELPEDSQGKNAFLAIKASQNYIDNQLKNVMINILVSLITSIMIAAEVIVFILAAITSYEERHAALSQPASTSGQPLGIVRGLSFFFAMFQYMAMAFVSIVLSEIYKPIVIFGYQLPYDIVMGLPLSIQILTSIITSWLSGRLIQKSGWKPVAFSGILIMAAGTILAASAREPYLFLFSQIVIGTGLGLSKTSFDIYAVLAAGEQEMERYTSNSNAGIIVGMSCASAIGAVIAGAVGYSKAYLVMALFGCVVAGLVLLFGQNMKEAIVSGSTDSEASSKPVKMQFDLKFFSYIAFMVLPYFFIMMFVDYFFPVYANQHGMATESIGYVFLIYGMVTSYIGSNLCTLLSKHFSCTALMTVFLGLVGVGILGFSIKNIFLFSVVLVMLIALSDGIMPSQQFSFVYSLPISKEVGFTKVVSIEGVFSSAIRGVAPIIFGYVMMAGNAGLFIVAVLLIICAFLFALVNLIGKSAHKRKGEEIHENS